MTPFLDAPLRRKGKALRSGNPLPLGSLTFSPMVHLDLRTRLCALPREEQKLIGSLMALLLQDPHKAREREWVAEQVTQLFLLTHKEAIEAHQDQSSALAFIESEVRKKAPVWVELTFALFHQTAQDLTPLLKDGLSRGDALAHAMTYFCPAT